jgi:outer membrane receptor for ferrienterochelin and colicin
MSYTIANTDIGINDSDIDNNEKSAHFKLKLKKRFSSRFKLNFGAEYFTTDFTEQFQSMTISPVDYGYNSNIAAGFAEADVFFSKDLAVKTGIRAEYSALFNDFSISPRISLAYKTCEDSQLSLAYGDFYQSPNSDILKFAEGLKPQQTKHYIINYQLNKEGQIFRAEAFYKDYKNLVKYDTEFAAFDSNFNNSGRGFAKGIDLFWRDNRSIKNTDYWISYSLLDSERDYKNYPTMAQPNFANTHNLSVVGKYFITDWKSQVGFSYALASGRTYTNPNLGGFLDQKTKTYNSLSVNWAYLVDQQKILYFSINNVLGFKNINGYQYASTPDLSGHFDRMAMRPAADQFFFVGFFWTISEDNTSNQLDNL